ncbi:MULTISPECIES: PRD domain-containing protein [Enterococcus]|uniref:BglG family transcription antiterminator n=1 Tax=Enterococcus sp. AZ103 TaxID=2774628 RepID=UPI003F27C1A0
MQLSKKESSLIEIFLSTKKILTAQEIADNLRISTKTVYRLVKKINELSSNGPVIETQTGKGLSLNYKRYLKVINEQENTQEDNAEGRRNRILLELLFKSPHPMDIQTLYEGQFVSNELIIKDIEKMRETVKPYQLAIKKKRNLVSLVGSEKEIRHLSYKLISMGSFLTTETYVVNDETMNSYDADLITSLLEYIEKMVGNPIPYPYNVNIFSHIYILLSRFRKGKVANPEVSKLSELDGEEKNLIQQNQEKFEIAKKIIQRIEDYLVAEIDEIEVFYLFQYIMASRVSTNENAQAMTNESEEVTILALHLAKYLKAELNFSFIEIIDDASFLEHLRLMLYRSKNGIIVKNELIQDIRREYSEIYVALQKALDDLSSEFESLNISDDEIGFLVLYFAQILEKKRFQRRVLIMCSSGVGTSELLKIKVQRAFPDLDIVDVVSLNQYKKNYEKLGKESFDFILTTVSLDNKSNVPSLLVNFMFTQRDQENVAKLLEGL